jgi:hypothetical protein
LLPPTGLLEIGEDWRAREKGKEKGGFGWRVK